MVEMLRVVSLMGRVARQDTNNVCCMRSYSMGKPGRDVHRSKLDLQLNVCLELCRSKLEVECSKSLICVFGPSYIHLVSTYITSRFAHTVLDSTKMSQFIAKVDKNCHDPKSSSNEFQSQRVGKSVDGAFLRFIQMMCYVRNIEVKKPLFM